jgi:hypothetical protein
VNCKFSSEAAKYKNRIYTKIVTRTPLTQPSETSLFDPLDSDIWQMLVYTRSAVCSSFTPTRNVHCHNPKEGLSAYNCSVQQRLKYRDDPAQAPILLLGDIVDAMVQSEPVFWDASVVWFYDAGINSLRTNILVHSPPWESRSASPYIPRLLWNPKFLYRAHKSPKLVPILSRLNPLHKVSPDFFRTNFNIIFGSISRISKWSFSSGFQTKVRMHFSSLNSVLHVPPIWSSLIWSS